MNSLLFEIRGSVAIITHNRPEAFNAYNIEMGNEMLNALAVCKEDDAIRAVLLTATGKSFCAGQDLKEIVDPTGPSLETVLQDRYNPIVLAIRNLDKPVICAVNGVAAGAGANLALACDITFAASSASFIQAFSKIGLVPDSGGTFNLPRLVGAQRAVAWMMSGEKISAAEAQACGMIYKVIADEELAEFAINYASQMAEMPTKALALTKKLLNASFQNTLEEQLDLESKYQIDASKTADYQEGVQAFIEKRKAIFQGK
ncbi:MAG: enoyl-CoA hydratase-related protein [Saprospiraceae bacterium]